MNNIKICLLVCVVSISFSACFISKKAKKKENKSIKSATYRFYVYDSIDYFLKHKKLSFFNYSDGSASPYRDDSIVIKYNRNGTIVLDTIPNPDFKKLKYEFITIDSKTYQHCLDIGSTNFEALITPHYGIPMRTDSLVIQYLNNGMIRNDTIPNPNFKKLK